MTFLLRLRILILATRHLIIHHFITSSLHHLITSSLHHFIIIIAFPLCRPHSHSNSHSLTTLVHFHHIRPLPHTTLTLSATRLLILRENSSSIKRVDKSFASSNLHASSLRSFENRSIHSSPLGRDKHPAHPHPYDERAPRLRRTRNG